MVSARDIKVMTVKVVPNVWRSPSMSCSLYLHLNRLLNTSTQSMCFIDKSKHIIYSGLVMRLGLSCLSDPKQLIQHI